MKNGLSHNNTTIPSILIDIFSLQIVFGLIYYISSFFLSYCSLFHSHFGLFGIFEIKNEAKKTNVDKGKKRYLISSRESSLLDDEDCLFGRDIHMVMEKLGVKGSLEGEGEELEKRWGCNEMCGIFEEEPSLEEVKEAFGVFDENEDGFIDAWELQRVLCVLGLRHGKELKACNMMIREFDENNDGKIDFNEFVQLMFKSF